MADLVVVAANVVKYDGAAVESGTAGEAITAGQSIYRKAADSKMYKAKCDTAAAAACVGVALNNAAAGQPVTWVKSGGVNPGVAVVVGSVYGVTDTAGGIGLVSERGAADYITLLGIATTTSRIEVAINKSGVAISA